ncbi:tagatose-6-phosphate kinase [Marinithermofilum abyssi]|uniref:Tagatose-6-phosphate kinase n=1 Tax=Marinithermofilum abyssi TaxID=1571185 RepID=A0A8J2VEF8_9BACL|nr:1-phosphofructokinase [Marinithermofilum abyssi]GGE09362.1 tagatose-6-phosphate kinase [Marinithermofilum abyssi]
MGKIVTLTLNPAIDKTVTLPRLEPGRVNRLSQVRIDPGGKGINVARALHQLGADVIAVGFNGGWTGRLLVDHLQREGIHHCLVTLQADTRINWKLVETEANRVTDINEPGFQVTEKEMETLEQRLASVLEEADAAVFSGSLPDGVSDDVYYRLIRLAHRKDVPVFLDADGMSFRKGVEAVPFAVKPNLDELAKWTGSPIQGDQDVREAGHRLLDKGVEAAVISMGESGAWFFTKEQELRTIPVPVENAHPVGAGDAMVAGLVYGVTSGWNWEKTARFATAAGSVAASYSGTQFGSLQQVEEAARKVRFFTD